MIDVTPTPDKNGNRNNLAFYSLSEYGSPSQLMRVSFILNVNYQGEKNAAHAEMARVAGAVAVKILGVEPKGFKTAIQQGASKKWKSGEWMTEVKTTIWPTGLGHDIKVTFKPSASE